MKFKKKLKTISVLSLKDARVGYKSQTDSFLRYKIEFGMIPEERIITGVWAADGAYVNGSELRIFIRNKACGLTIQEVYGDKAYFRKSILDTLKNDSVEAIIPVNASAFRIHDNRFHYNKQWAVVLQYG